MVKIFIKPESIEEQEYCIKNKIELRRLKNGITIVGVACQMDNAAFSDIRFQFQNGSYSNPAGQVHFLEHFFNKKITKLAQENMVDVNAYTSLLETVELLKGVCNPDVTDFGVWQVLDPIRKAIENPITDESNIESEKKVIGDEIIRRRNDHDFQTGKYFREVLYAKDNPNLDEPLVTGDISDIEKITSESLKEIVERVLIPKGLFISVYTEGDTKTTKLVVDKIESLFKDFPREKIKLVKPDKKLSDKINANFKAGQTYIKNSGIKNNRITFEFVWVMPAKFPNPERFAINRIISPLQGYLHDHSRVQGWGYYTDVYLDKPSYNLAILGIRVDTNKIPEPERFAKEMLFHEIKENVIKKVNAQVIKEICDLEDKKQKAVPVGKYDRLDWALDGLKDFGEIIDQDEIRKIFLTIKPKHIDSFMEILKNTEPAIIITGDL